ncbi:MAG: SDR family NAD(P)-dependent oxidoreductase [Gemmatimonadales bacterium]
MNHSVAIVTGATLGIGRATSFALAEAGFAVGVTARTADRVAALVAELRAAGYEAAGSAADVSDPGEVAAFVAQVTRDLGPPEVLVNNAGIIVPKPFADTTLEDWDRTFAVNVRSLFLVTRAVLPAMRERGRGDIVNVASLAGKNGVANAVAYAASKHAVLGFAKSLMLEVRKDGIRVVSVCPGSVDTPMMRGQDTLHPDFDRILGAEDVAAAIVAAVRLPRRAMMSEIDLRPSNP